MFACVVMFACSGGSSLPPDAAPGPDADVAGERACETALAASWGQTPPTTGLGSPSARASYTNVIGAAMAAYQVPGGALAVAKDGKLVLLVGIGLADVEDLQPAHADQLWRIASLSKQITAAGILLLVERGQLALTDTVFSILTGYTPIPGHTMNAALNNITIAHLLHHAGGWNRDFEAVGDPMFDSLAIAAALGQPGPATTDMTIRYMLDKPLTYTPGSTYCYSNFGYALLGKVIEAKTGMAYDTWIRANVLAPVGVTDMVLGQTLPAGRADQEVKYYGFPGQGLATSVFPAVPSPVPWQYGGWAIEAMAAHGGWIASPIDQVKFALGVDGSATRPDIINATSRAAMVANPNLPSCTAAGGTTPASSTYWYGFGWSVNSAANIWHLGSLDGTSTEDVAASNGYAWAVFFNTRPSNANGFGGRIDNDMWTALGGAGTWTTQDLFDQAAPFGAWMPAAAWDTQAAGLAGMNRWPVRIEGRQNGGAVEYRAQIVPLHPGMAVDYAAGLDCLAYRARAAANQAAGRQAAGLHSYVGTDGARRYQATWAGGL